MSFQGHGYCQINQQIARVWSNPFISSLKNKTEIQLRIQSPSGTFLVRFYIPKFNVSSYILSISVCSIPVLGGHSPYQFPKSKTNLAFKDLGTMPSFPQRFPHYRVEVTPSSLFYPCLWPAPLWWHWPLSLIYWLLLMYRSYHCDKPETTSGSADITCIWNTESMHAMMSCLRDEWKKNWRVLFRTFPFNAATVSWETYLGLELMTSWHGILWSHHTVIVSKGVLFCLHPIFFSHKIVFYKLWFRKHFQINKIYRGAPLPVTLGLPSWEQAVVMGRI